MRREGGELGVGFFPFFHLGLEAGDHGAALLEFGVEFGDHVRGRAAFRDEGLVQGLGLGGEFLDFFVGGDLGGLGCGDLSLGIAEFEHRVAQRIPELALHGGLFGRMEGDCQRNSKQDGQPEDAGRSPDRLFVDRVHGQNFELRSIWMIFVL